MRSDMTPKDKSYLEQLKLMQARINMRRGAWEAGKEYRRIDDAETFMQGDQWPPGWARERPAP
jgi:hypothetical protein